MSEFNPNKINQQNLENNHNKQENRNDLENFQEVNISKEIPIWLVQTINLIKQKITDGEEYSVSKVLEELNKGVDGFYKDIEKDGGIHGVFNKISHGTYLDNRYLNHVVFGKNTYRPLGDKEHSNNLKEGNSFSPTEIIKGYALEFAVGCNVHFGSDPTKKMIIVNPDNQSLRKFMASEDNSYGRSFENALRSRFNSDEELDNYIDTLKQTDTNNKTYYIVDRKDIPLLWELLKRKLPIKEKDAQDLGNGVYGGFGFTLPIMEGDKGSRWCDIADTIIDLEQGKAWYRKDS